MAEVKVTVGQAIDLILSALSSLEQKQQRTVVATVCSLLEIQTPDRTLPCSSSTSNGREDSGAIVAALHPTPPSAHVHGGGSKEHPEIDIRALKQQKVPGSVTQMACVVAYYLQELAPEGERKKTVTIADLEKYFKQAGYKLPVKLEMTLIHAKTAGYFEAVARGEYKLTRVGYNLVTHGMPKSKAVV